MTVFIRSLLSRALDTAKYNDYSDMEYQAVHQRFCSVFGIRTPNHSLGFTYCFAGFLKDVVNGAEIHVTVKQTRHERTEVLTALFPENGTRVNRKRPLRVTLSSLDGFRAGQLNAILTLVPTHAFVDKDVLSRWDKYLVEQTVAEA